MAELHGKGGNVYIANLLLEDCEDTWNSGTHGTASLETTLVKVGSGSAKVVMSSVQNGDIVMYETMSGAKDISAYTHILCWARASGNVAAADLRLGLGVTAGGASPTTLADLPALVANTWKYCRCTEVTGSEMNKTSAGTIIGLEMNANAQDITVYLDDIRAAKNVAGIKSWSLDYTADVVDVTDFASSGKKEFVAGGSSWSGSFEGYKDGAPLTIGQQYGIELAESSTATQMWAGNVIITGAHENTSIDGPVTITYDFQGVGALRVATA